MVYSYWMDPLYYLGMDFFRNTSFIFARISSTEDVGDGSEGDWRDGCGVELGVDGEGRFIFVVGECGGRMFGVGLGGGVSPFPCMIERILSTIVVEDNGGPLNALS